MMRCPICGNGPEHETLPDLRHPRCFAPTCAEVAAAIAAEREACAKVAEDGTAPCPDCATPEIIAAAIRARGSG